MSHKLGMIIKRYIIKSLEMIHVPHVAIHQHIGQYVGYFINVMLSVAGIAFIKCNLLLLINFINVMSVRKGIIIFIK